MIKDFLLILLVASGTVWAQVNASITGQVADASGAPVGEVTVTVKSLETGAVRTTSTDESGNYHFKLIPVGTYTLQVRHGNKVEDLKPKPGQSPAYIVHF